jgi:hypothetical protein
MLQYIPSKITIYKENKMETIAKVIGIAVVGIVAIVVLGLILSLPVMWLWNACLVAAIPGIKEIGWLQAWGIMILCGMLFKNSSSSSSSSN